MGIWSMALKNSFRSRVSGGTVFSSFFSPSLPTRITLVPLPAPSLRARINALVSGGVSFLLSLASLANFSPSAPMLPNFTV